MIQKNLPIIAEERKEIKDLIEAGSTFINIKKSIRQMRGDNTAPSTKQISNIRIEFSTVKGYFNKFEDTKPFINSCKMKLVLYPQLFNKLNLMIYKTLDA